MRHALFLALLTAVAAPALAQQRDAPAPGQTIVVTGVRIQDLRDRLAACLARGCPPNEDIDATLALAEALFFEGEYHDARTAVRASLSRNRRHVRAFPEPVSDLYRVNARLARNLGLDRDANHSTYEILRALQAGIPVEDHRHFTARLEIVQALVAFGQYPEARRQLREVVERADAAGREDIAAIAELRLIWIAYLQAPHSGAALRDLVAMSRSADQRRATGARMLLVRIYSERGERRLADAVMAELGRGSRSRQLLYNPPYELSQREERGRSDDRRDMAVAGTVALEGPNRVNSAHTALVTANLADRMTGNFDDKWIDVSFRISPEGRVEELEVARQSADPAWADPLLVSIRGRRYSAGDTATYRLERYTYTSGFQHNTTGTHIAARSARARVEYFDLSEGIAAPESAPAARNSDN
ncbi:MAG TPA: hypothetical protein VMS43_04055 [Allosphingosinicella sp.]|nr:hypothetical protein [Allosphingosinicella sp.]